MIETNPKNKVKIHWNVSPYDYSKDKEKEIVSAASKKYSIPKENIVVVPNFITLNESGESESITGKVIDDIQDPSFQQKLFKEYLKINNITDCDFDYIVGIDKDINGRIDYQAYDKLKKFKLKWIRFDNFQSYGKDNFFDFTTLKGLVLLNGQPANQSGKTTFAVDLLHFLLFGKTSKAKVQEDIFNKYLKEETNVVVEGCFNINGEDYIIKRTLSRPKLGKRTEKSKVTQKVDYYRVIGDKKEELDDFVEMETGEDTRSTNKIIKESIGREDDFDLIMCITGSNLNSLIDEKPTDRGRLFSRWVGLLPLEEKNEIAREKYNSEIKPSLLSNKYDREVLKQEIEAYKVEIKELKKSNTSLSEENTKCDKEIASLEESRNTLLTAKEQIDNDVLKIDKSTIESRMKSIIDEGKTKKYELEKLLGEISEIGNVSFSVEEYDNIVDERSKAMMEQQSKRSEAIRIKNLIEQLKKGEYCPTCGKKLDNVDNQKQISEQTRIYDELVVEGKKVTSDVNRLNELVEAKKGDRDKYNRLNKLNTQKPIIELNIERLRSEYIELNNLKKEYEKNASAIEKNNAIDISIRNTDANIRAKREVRDSNIKTITQNNSNISSYEKEIKEREDIVKKICDEEKVVYNWKVYLDMVGKNGISKMVMRKTLPIVNARLSQLLDDVCDFDVNVDVNSRNEITFNIVRNGVVADLNSGSGFERTASALALRTVLADISTIPQMNFLVLDEILSGVAFDNYENIFSLINKSLKSYDFAFFITHVDAVKEYAESTVTIKKENNVSRLLFTKNGK